MVPYTRGGPPYSDGTDSTARTVRSSRHRWHAFAGGGNRNAAARDGPLPSPEYAGYGRACETMVPMGESTTAPRGDGGRTPAWWVRHPPRVGVSRCLLGDPVRFDAGHKRNRFLTDILGRHVEWVAVCPEVEVGMGTPRETLRLVRAEAGPRMVAADSDRDHTSDMAAFSRRRVAELEGLDLAGYVLKSKSPSCGLSRLPVYAGGTSGAEVAHRDGRGLFASALTSAEPLLAVVEEDRLSDPLVREDFLERLFAHARLAELFAGRWQPRDLAGFHTRHALQLTAHDPALAREAGHLVDSAGYRPAGEVERAYSATFLRALAVRPTRDSHVDALRKALWQARRHLDDVRQGLHDSIDAYRDGHFPRSAAASRLWRYADAEGIRLLRDQTYFDPFPAELSPSDAA